MHAGPQPRDAHLGSAPDRDGLAHLAYDRYMQLLEREAALGELDAAIDGAVDGAGSVVLVTGEAGIGKTRLVRTFADRWSPTVRVLWGGCDDLSTPRPLGPFRDIAATAGGALQAMMGSQPSRSEVFDSFYDALLSPNPPTLVVVEDVHWADAATLDVLKFLGRRIDRIPATLVVTYRPEEIGEGHLLPRVLGDLPGYAIRRVDLTPLSKVAVAALATSYPGSADHLFEATGGNPFLVTEALAVPEFPVPPGVRDAVATRIARLGVHSREVVEAVAVVPGRVERGILEQLVVLDDESLEECRARGLLEFDGTGVWYRHELVRGAVVDALTERRRYTLNSAMLVALIDSEADVSLIVHHAREAGSGEAVARYGPIAARQAAAASSHREALAHYRASVEHLDLVVPHDRAELLLDYAIERYLTGEVGEAMEAARRALDRSRMDGTVEQEGRALRWLSRFHWWLGQSAKAEATGLEAVDILERVPGSRELPMAYSNLGQIHMLAQDAFEAEVWATKAILSAQEVGDQSALAHALNNLGSTRARAGDPGGIDLLRQSLEVSLREGLEDHGGRAYANIIWTLLDFRQFDEARAHIEAGLEYAEKLELEGSLYYITAERARLHLCLGEWDAAERDALWVTGRPEEPGITRMPALSTLAQLEVRRGGVAAPHAIDDARALAGPTGELQRIAPVAVARAEHAWLHDDLPELRRAVEPVNLSAVEIGQPWVVDELAFWMWRAGASPAVPDGPGTPYADQIGGNWQAAADGWDRLGCPYERATALFDSNEDVPLLLALEILDGLGADPAARLVRRKLQTLGVRNVPRGPLPSTRANPAGLTGRQLEVAELLIEGLTNAEIADRLFVSPKTVDHHVSAVRRSWKRVRA